MGCLAKGLIGLALIIILLVLAGKYVFLHTALPARGFIALLNQSSDIQIEGISGSIATGFSVDTMRFTDEAGNINALNDVRLHYKKEKTANVITEVHVGRGHFYVDRNHKKTCHEDDMNDHDVDEPQSTSLENSNFMFIVKRVSINNVIIEDVKSGIIFNLDEIELSDLELGETSKLGNFVIHSTACDLEILPLQDSGTNYSHSISGSLKSGFSKKIKTNIDLKGTIDLNTTDDNYYALTAFGGQLRVRNTARGIALMTDKLTIANYIKNAPPLTDFDLSLARNGKSYLAKGTFLIGENLFEIDRKGILPEGGRLEDELVAVHKGPRTEYRIQLGFEEQSDNLFPFIYLSTKPSMPLSDSVSMLLTGKKYDALTREKRDLVNRSIKHFSEP